VHQKDRTAKSACATKTRPKWLSSSLYSSFIAELLSVRRVSRRTTEKPQSGESWTSGLQKIFLLELLSEIRELLFQIRDLLLEGGNITLQPGDLLSHG
jgi:hypothetical protein